MQSTWMQHLTHRLKGKELTSRGSNYARRHNKQWGVHSEGRNYRAGRKVLDHCRKGLLNHIELGANSLFKKRLHILILDRQPYSFESY